MVLPEYEGKRQKGKKAKKKSKAGLVIGLLILFAVIIGGVYVVMKRGGLSGAGHYSNASDFDLSLLDPDDDMVVFSQGESHNSVNGTSYASQQMGGDIDGLLEA